MEAFAASRRAPRGPVDGDGELEREFVAGECESVRFVTKTKRGKHLRTRRGMAELLGKTATSIDTGAGGLRDGGASSGVDEKGEREGLGGRSYRRAALQEWEAAWRSCRITGF